jgi:hypothetical protein
LVVQIRYTGCYSEAVVPSVFCVGGPDRIQEIYSEMENICYAVIISVRKLQHYFEAHTIKVLTN